MIFDEYLYNTGGAVPPRLHQFTRKTMSPEKIRLHFCHMKLTVILTALLEGAKPSKEDMAWIKELFSINYHIDSEDSGKVIFFLFDRYMHEKSEHLTDQLLYLLQLDTKMQHDEELTKEDWVFILNALEKWDDEIYRQLAAK